MVELHAVRAYHPTDPAASDLICPVYDTLSDADVGRLAPRPYNAAGFVARPTSMVVEEFVRTASERLESAIRARAFTQDSAEAFYVYGIRYTPPPDIVEALPRDTRRAEYLLLGLVGAIDLARTPEEVIARHENAFPERINERIRLTEATGMYFAPIMAGYTLPSHAINDVLEKSLGLDRRNMALDGTATPLVRATLDGTEHRLWRLEDHDARRRIAELLAPLRILILDGHHRYGAARALLTRHRPGVAPLVMLVESRDRALHLLPWHRAVAGRTATIEDLVARAGSRFVSVDFLGPSMSIPSLVEELGRMSRHHVRGFLAIGPAGAWRFRGPDSSDGGFDFDLLHGYLSDEFQGDPRDFGVFRSPRRAVEAMRSSSGDWSGGVAFLMPRLREEAIEERAFSTGRVMAHKSTMFLPKVAEGVLFAPVREPPSW